jgi:hypothetical protein
MPSLNGVTHAGRNLAPKEHEERHTELGREDIFTTHAIQKEDAVQTGFAGSNYQICRR